MNVSRVRLAELPALCSRLMPDCATGDGWASRLEDSLLHGTIPVIIQDGVAEKFYGVVDFAAISVRIAEADIERVCDLECWHACWNWSWNCNAFLVHDSTALRARCCLLLQGPRNLAGSASRAHCTDANEHRESLA